MPVASRTIAPMINPVPMIDVVELKLELECDVDVVCDLLHRYQFIPESGIPGYPVHKSTRFPVLIIDHCSHTRLTRAGPGSRVIYSYGKIEKPTKSRSYRGSGGYGYPVIVYTCIPHPYSLELSSNSLTLTSAKLKRAWVFWVYPPQERSGSVTQMLLWPEWLTAMMRCADRARSVEIATVNLGAHNT